MPENDSLTWQPRPSCDPEAGAATDAAPRPGGMAPSPNTSMKHPQNKIYPYLLRELSLIRVNQV